MSDRYSKYSPSPRLKPNLSVRPRRRRRKPTALVLALAAAALAILACGAYVIVYFYLPNFKSQDFHEYFGFDKNEVVTIMGGKRIDAPVKPVLRDGELYFPVDFIKNNIDRFIYWDAAEQKLTVTTADKVIRFNAEDVEYYVNGQKNPTSLNLPVYAEGGAAYLPAGLIMRLYPVDIRHMEDYNLAVIDFTGEDITTASVASRRAAMRYKPDPKAYIEQKLVKNDVVYTYGEEGDFTRVRAANGLLGYVATAQLAPGETVPGTAPEPPPEAPPKKIAGKINLLWDQIDAYGNNSDGARYVARAGLDVLSPTWFRFNINTLNGDIVNIADLNYVNWAHENGYQVWAVVSDLSSDKSKVKNMDIGRAILPNTEYRDNAIRQLLTLVATYGLDGLNFDFEYIQQDVAADYVQFFRELAPYMRLQGAALSVDMFNPVPSNYWSAYYSRSDVAASADYICVMAYDEHTYGDEAGPVASLRFVENGIQATLAEVPKKQVLLGLPYYARVWKEYTENGVPETDILNLSMQSAYDLFKKNGASFVWNAAIGSYYGEFTRAEDGISTTYKVWLEDERSIEEKLKLFQKYDLAGVAGWNRAWLQKDEVWDLLREYVKK